MDSFITLDQLDTTQLNQYHIAVSKAFPRIISESKVIINHWDRLEKYFSSYQFYMISSDGNLIGFMNTVPFHFDKPLNELPGTGWDWMLTKGVNDFEYNQHPNHLGGLQVIVRSKYQGQGYSKTIIQYVKQQLKTTDLNSLVIPIRPTKKHLFPNMSMKEYMNLKDGNKIYDPWLRTHLNSGAKIIKICLQSMTMKGDIPFWESILDEKITSSGEYILKGALSPIKIELAKNYGEYIEPNIWIKYDV